MDVYEYLKTVRSQLTTPGICDAIEQELRSHLEDQKAAFMEKGMDEQEAEEASVTEMGDPVEVGLALNEIHREKPAGKYIFAFLFLNLLMAACNVWEIMHNKTIATATGTVVSVLFFLIPAIAVYFFFIRIKFETQELGKLFLLAGNLGLLFTCQAIIRLITGRGPVFQDPYFFHGTLLLFLGYLGILFHYRRREKGWQKCQIFGILIVAVTVLTTGDVLFIAEASVIYGILYTSVYYRGWFPGTKKRTLMGAWAPALVSFGIIVYRCLPSWLNSFSINYEKLAKLHFGKPKSIEAVNDFNFLPVICQKLGLTPVYFILLLGILFLGALILYRRRLTNEWGKLVFLACSLILAVMLINGALAAMGVLSGEMAFAPFLWNLIISSYEGDFADFSQCIIYFLMAAFLTRFTVRDSVTVLEIESQRIHARKEKETLKNS